MLPRANLYDVLILMFCPCVYMQYSEAFSVLSGCSWFLLMYLIADGKAIHCYNVTRLTVAIKLVIGFQ